MSHQGSHEAADSSSRDRINPGNNSYEQSQSNSATDQSNQEPSKQPNRIIRLTRPANPFSSTRTEGSTSSDKVENGSSAPAGSTTAATGAPAPGSRLAALQRPGSPMHRILQRAQSPALAAAAARMNRQSSGESSYNTENANNQNINPSDTNNVNTIGNSSTDPGRESRLSRPSRLRSGRASIDDASGQAVSENDTSKPAHEPRTIIPPRISSSGLTGSILLRRPASPGRQLQVNTNKPNVNQSLDGNSPRSPPSDTSPNTGSTQDDSQTRAAIRNKLRANSFKLKDLLTKKPFTKSADDGEEVGDEAADDGKSNEEEVRSSAGSRLLKTIGDGPDRTRWRREGIPSLTRSKSTVSDRTTSLISARYRQSKLLSEQSKGDSEQTVANSTEVAKDQPVPTEESNVIGANHPSNTLQSNPHSDTKLEGQSRVMLGATLLRSPRTRDNSENSNVPSLMSKSGTDSGSINKPEQQVLIEQQPKRFDNVDRQAKALSELEKEAEANLVFDSQMIGQNEVFESSKSVDSDKSSGNSRPYTRSQSEQQRISMEEDMSGQQKIMSQPGTPHKELQTVRGSKSYDNTPDGDFSRSSAALKRSLAVTDLDQAMKDRDQQRLNSLFKEHKLDGGESRMQQQNIGESRLEG